MSSQLFSAPASNSPLPSTTFVIGGARSGKSLHAEQLATATGLSVCYVATAHRFDGDAAFSERIAKHAARRPSTWALVEAQHDLGDVLLRNMHADRCVLIDCLTLWLTGLLCPPHAEAPLPEWTQQLASFDAALTAVKGRVIVVSNEIGMGVVPMGAMTRQFVDELGRLNQRVAARCERVVLTVAGLPLTIK